MPRPFFPSMVPMATSAALTTSAQRRLLRIADETFWRAHWDLPPGVCFTYAEIRLEAAFRAWLRTVDVEAPAPESLPDESRLHFLAAGWDCEYGEETWWDWSVWSSCETCAERGFVGCQSCRELTGFMELALPGEQAWDLEEEWAEDACADDAASAGEGVPREATVPLLVPPPSGSTSAAVRPVARTSPFPTGTQSCAASGFRA